MSEAKKKIPTVSGEQAGFKRETEEKKQSLQDQLEMFMKSSCHLRLWLGMKSKHKSCAELHLF